MPNIRGKLPMKNQASRERWKNKGFTFLELLVTWAVVGIGITSLSMVISRDISTLTRGRSDHPGSDLRLRGACEDSEARETCQRRRGRV